MKKLTIIVACLLVALLGLRASAAPGEVKIGHFDAVLDGTGLLASGGGDGYIWPGGAVWQYYDQAPGEPWWNQWWYNDPLLQPGGKDVRLEFDYDVTAAPAVLVITINWSNELWIGYDRPPDPTEEWAIERLAGLIGGFGWPYTIYGDGGGGLETGWFSLPIDYNPEWVSVDIRGISAEISGTIYHVCVPEPTTLGLLLIGGLAVLRRRK